MNLVEQYNTIAPTYDAEYQVEKYRKDEERTAEFLRSINPSGFIICQGIGTGQDYEMLNPGPDDIVLGLDISEEMLKRAREKFPLLQTQLWDCAKVYPAHADVVVSLYGTINYAGLHTFINQIRASGAKKFCGVMFSPQYLPPLGTDYVRHYWYEEICDMFDQYDIPFRLDPLFGTSLRDQNYWVLRNV